jgi:dTDP-glucose 4,6-dehydratase
VVDHCEAIWSVIQRGALGETYNVGGNCELCNTEVVRRICHAIAEETGCAFSTLTGLITFVEDRPGHD